MDELSTLLIFHDLDDRPSGNYPDLPKHITSLRLPNVANSSVEPFRESVRNLLDREVAPFEVMRGGIDRYGPNNDIEVALVEDPTGQLRQVHSSLLQTAWLHSLDGVVDLRYAGLRYSPHSTRSNGIEMPRRRQVEHFTLARKVGSSSLREFTRYNLNQKPT